LFSRRHSYLAGFVAGITNEGRSSGSKIPIFSAGVPEWDGYKVALEHGKIRRKKGGKRYVYTVTVTSNNGVKSNPIQIGVFHRPVAFKRGLKAGLANRFNNDRLAVARHKAAS
jgi:hypothetical protein